MEPPPRPSASKLRLMCSYGGRVVPRPHSNSKSLFYLGGETRIVTVDRASSAAATLSSLASHLSATLSVAPPFALKYQLPDSDLDALISLCTDDDLAVMVDELDRLSSSSDPRARPSRIRLFLFPTRPQSGSESAPPPVLCHPKTETWFIDALKGARIVGKEDDFDQSGGAESVVLETSSSFGSTSSSVSLSNLPPLVAQVDELGTKNHPQDPVARDSSSVASANSNPRTGPFTAPVAHVASLQNQTFANTLESKSGTFCSGAQPCTTIPVSGYPVNPQFEQLQHVQFVPTASPYRSQNPAFAVPVSQYCPVYQLQPQQLCYMPNHSYPTYAVPVPAAQSQNLQMQGPSRDALAIASSQLAPDFSPLVNPPQVACKEVPEALRKPELAAHVPITENKQNLIQMNQVRKHPQPVDVVHEETCYYDDEYVDDPARLQIYKSQPLPPTLPSQYQTMTEANTLLLTEALVHLNMDRMKRQSKS
ncbi:uncharacterized protein LOC115738771 isoform X2 [Rhodamnia argentea]|uniref:Uncharacterized protein LOC115738771 isoform X2 n=1 Tax=Rhodamnia argentea TaxID=178133 RepID=A0A8B8NYM7_9MYRT|nr:uncharacterized protein LOC115738771 isoform X2 [Rhodamnia argentea]